MGRLAKSNTFTELDVNIKVLLFSRWISINYGTPKYNVNDTDKNWWAEKLEYFNKTVYPTMILNGSVENTKTFLEKI